MLLSCPHCRQNYTIPPEYYGRTVNCPNCSGGFIVPNAAAVETTPTQQVMPNVPASTLPQEAPGSAPSPNVPACEPRIAELKERFAAEDFRINDAGNTPDFPFDFSASKVRFDLVGVPTFLEEFFIFETFDSELYTPAYNAFLDDAREWALANENTMPKAAELSQKAMSFLMKLNGGNIGGFAAEQIDKLNVREATCIIYVYAVAIAPSIGAETLEWLWSKKSAAARKGGSQPAFVVPVFFNTQDSEIHHFKKRPILGNVYYTEARKVMKKRLID